MVVALTLAAVMGVFLPLKARGQQPPTPGNGPNCSPIEGIKSDAVITRLFNDGDGDVWMVIRYASTGTLHVGFLSRATNKFCIAGQGQTNRES